MGDCSLEDLQVKQKSLQELLSPEEQPNRTEAYNFPQVWKITNNYCE